MEMHNLSKSTKNSIIFSGVLNNLCMKTVQKRRGNYSKSKPRIILHYKDQMLTDDFFDHPSALCSAFSVAMSAAAFSFVFLSSAAAAPTAPEPINQRI